MQLELCYKVQLAWADHTQLHSLMNSRAVCLILEEYKLCACFPASPLLSGCTAPPSASFWFLYSLVDPTLYTNENTVRQTGTPCTLYSKLNSFALVCSGCRTSVRCYCFTHLPTQQTQQEAILFRSARRQKLLLRM